MSTFACTAVRVSSGILVWALHFGAIYGSTALACARGLAPAVPWSVGLATLIAAAAAAAIALRALRGPGFEAWLTAMLAGIALVAILWEGLPVLMVPACA